MRFQPSTFAILSFLAASGSSEAFSSSFRNERGGRSAIYSTMAEPMQTSPADTLTSDIISKLHFREAQRELERMQLDTSGTLTAMRNRLRDASLQRNAKNAEGDGVVRAIDEEQLNQVSLGLADLLQNNLPSHLLRVLFLLQGI